MGFDVKYMNPFLKASIEIVKQTCSMDLQVGKPALRKETTLEDSVVIIVGITGEVQGQVFISFPVDNALTLASQMMMMGMPVTGLDEMAISALSELGNMIMGNASTLLSGVGVLTDITPPTLMTGDVKINQNIGQIISVPLSNDTINMTLDITLKEKG